VVVKANTVAKPAAGAKSAAKAAPAKPVVAVAKPAAAKPVAVKPAAPLAKPAVAAAKPVAAKPVVKDLKEKDSGFRKGDFVVYPTHGVGKILGVEAQEVSGHSLQLIIIHFEKDRMTLRVPVAKAKNSGLRKLSSRKVMDAALQTLKGRSRVKRAMWSRRAQEYEAKINSGDPVSIAEVVRDLHRNADQPDQSYSERQIYQAALDRLVRELAAIDGIDEQSAHQRLHQVLKAVAA
jgi:CarD family transcriptional regulator